MQSTAQALRTPGTPGPVLASSPKAPEPVSQALSRAHCPSGSLACPSAFSPRKPGQQRAEVALASALLCGAPFPGLRCGPAGDLGFARRRGPRSAGPLRVHSRRGRRGDEGRPWRRRAPRQSGPGPLGWVWWVEAAGPRLHPRLGTWGADQARRTRRLAGRRLCAAERSARRSWKSPLPVAAMRSLWREILLETLLGKLRPPAPRLRGARSALLYREPRRSRGRLSWGGTTARSVPRIRMLSVLWELCYGSGVGSGGKARDLPCS